MKFEKIVHDLIQGSEAWQEFRLRHFGASEAAAMLGLSTKTKRTDLLHAKHTGIAKEFSDWLQVNVLDHGHEVEAKARPIIERIFGIELGPVTLSRGKLSASCDGLTMFHETAMEHKQWSVALAAAVKAKQLPEEHMPQCQQILLVTGAERVIFVVSDGTEENMEYMEVLPDPAWLARIEAGWDQFEKDLAEYVPAAPEPMKIVGHSPDGLPAIRSSVTGELVLESNIKEWEAAALAYIKNVRDHELKTDEDFANADAAAKWCETSKATLQGVRSNLMSATGDVNTAVGTLDRIMAELDQTRIAFDKAITARKDARKAEIVAEGVAKFKEHIAGLNKLLGKDYMPVIPADFGACIKNKRSFANMIDAVATTLVNAKIQADDKFKVIMANMTWLREHATEYVHLFADTSTLVQKPHDDFVAQAENRISTEKARVQAEQDRIREEGAAAARKKVIDDANQKNEMALQEIQGIQQQVYIATGGRLGVRKGGTIECIRETLAETEAWTITEEKFGVLTTAAQTAKDKAVSEIRGLLADAENKAAAPAPAAAQLPAAPVHAGVRMHAGNVNAVASPVTVNPVPAAANDDARINLGEINRRIAPLSITADGLAELGFQPAGKEGAATMYLESDYPRMCEVMKQHLTQVADLQVA